MSDFRRRFLCRLASVVAVAAVALTAAGQGMVSAVEAELFERFTRFIEWPADSSVGDDSRPFTVGVLGRHEIENVLVELARSGRIKGKSVEVRHLSGIEGVRGCQAVFVAKEFADQLDAIVASVRGRPVLTLADSPGFARRGIMINFTLEGDFVRFELNPSAAEASGLRFAPQLLQLGTTVD